ncbi:MAG: 2-oxo acid dehydrogenase subunit E2 [Ardenticatenia bacterium]|nr:2-oxo acid dehydrogenase subunit E2 [Ardenticatenia bacterium]
MATQVLMPKMGFDMEEGAVATWRKQEGEAVKAGDVIAEIETDKATVELEAPADGVLLKILVEPGQRVPVNSPIAIIGEPGERVDIDEASLSAGARPDVQVQRRKSEIKVSPVARRLAEEHGLDLRRVRGTGPGGRITREDVEAAVEAMGEHLPSPPGGVRASPAARRLAREHGLDVREVPGSGPGGRVLVRDVEAALAQAAAQLEPVTPPEAVSAGERVPLSRMRKRIAEVMTASKAPVPHFYVTVRVDMEAAMRLREEINTALAEEGLKVSINDFVVKAAALALRRFPNINASFAGDHILRHVNVHVGIAVALPDGLITVVVRDADRKSLGQLARETHEKVERAREGRLQADDVGGSTFTVSNLGMFGVEDFVAVITPPEAAILAVGAVLEEPVVRDGALVVGHTMRLTLSADHRVTDGAEAARFLGEIRRLLEHPLLLLVA